MIKPIPDIDICRHKMMGTLLLVHKAPLFEKGHYLGNVGFGEFEILSQSACISLLSIIRISLAEFKDRNSTARGAIDRMTIKERRKFYLEHQSVGISLRENGDLWIEPIHHKSPGGSGFSEVEERGVVSACGDEAIFMPVLLQCLSKAS